MTIMMDSRSSSRRMLYLVAVIAIFLVALGLRVWGNGFGLPYKYHFDERTYVIAAGRIGQGELHYEPYGPVGFSNTLFVTYGLIFVAGKILGIFSSAGEFAELYNIDPTIFYAAGRFMSALFGALTILPVFLLGKITRNQAAGLLAAILLAFSFLHVRDSHFAVPDITMTALITTAIALAAFGMQTNRLRYLFLAGLAGGVSAAMKYTGFLVILPLLWAGSVVARDYNKEHKGGWWKVIGLLLLAMSVGFAITSPQVFLRPLPYLQFALGQYTSDAYGGFEIWQVDQVSGWIFYLKTLSYSAGWILLLLGIAGAIHCLVKGIHKRDRYSILLLLFPLPYFLLMGSTSHYFARYALPLVPFLALFAGEAIVTATQWIEGRRSGWGWVVQTCLLLAAVGAPLVYDLRMDTILTRVDTRTIAKQWIESNLPANSKIAIDYEIYGPPLSTAQEPTPDSQKIYDAVVMTETGLSDHPLDWYRQQGFTYVITSSFISEIPLVFKEQDMEKKKFYASLDDELTLIADFWPNDARLRQAFIFDEIYGPIVDLWQRERPGPTIKVYQLTNESQP